MRLLHRRRPGPRAKTARPAAAPFLAACAEEARRLGHNYVGTEHLLLVLVRDPDGDATRVLQQRDVTPPQIEEALASWLGASEPGASRPKIDPDALATLGIDLETVRERLEQTFGPGALEYARASCLGICPRLKMALAYAVDYADGQPLTDEHILLGMLSVPDSVAARVLADLDVSLEAAEATAESHRE
jgi:ATP-dependent Clp protease ATP-binding subunit ClpA